MDLSAAFGLIGCDGRGQPGDLVLLRQQLEMANEAVAELQRDMERIQTEAAERIGDEMAKVRTELDTARRRERSAEEQLANAQAQNELLEFQLLELTAIRAQQKVIDRRKGLKIIDRDYRREGKRLIFRGR